MAAKRKYARMGEEVSKYECTNKKCKWQGTDEEKANKIISKIQKELCCPKCMNNEFYGLI